MTHHRWQVEVRQQLAHFLRDKLGESGKKIRRLLEQNGCKVNGKVERFGSVWVEKGNIVEFFLHETAAPSWAVLFENEFLKILDKPTNWVCSEENCERTFGRKLFLVHRLDKDTTGALLLAKTILVRDELMKLFATREVEKEYIALVDGVIAQDKGTIDNFLAKKGSFHGQTIWGSARTGDHAVTNWEVIARGNLETWVRCRPLTGRTHQIRVHMAEMGHPLLTDRQYAKSFRSKIFAARPLLHAHRLAFVYRGIFVSAVSPIPQDLKKSAPPGVLE